MADEMPVTVDEIHAVVATLSDLSFRATVAGQRALVDHLAVIVTQLEQAASVVSRG